MSRPTRRENSSQFQFRQRVPAALANVARGKFVLVELPAGPSGSPVTVSTVAGTFIKFSLRTSDPELAKIRHAAANTQVARHFTAWRVGPTTLPLRTLVALSGEVYRLYVEKFEDEPGSPDDWAAFKAFNRAAREGRLLNAPILLPGARQLASEAADTFGSGDLSVAVNRLPATPHGSTALERRFGMLTDWVLQKHGLSVDQDTRERLLLQVEQAATDAAWTLKRNASGDYTPDPKVARFPPVSLATSAVSLDALFERWEKETKPAASTRTTWLGNLRSLKEHVGEAANDITKITADHIVAWKDESVARGLAPKTINDSYLGSIKALFGYGVRNKLLATNPADGVRVAARSRAGTGKLPYSDDEVRRLLALAKKETDPARHWLPWLAAATGARIGELVQLWGARVKEVDGHHAIIIAPAEDGGSLKNDGSERTVPLHPVLVEMGFLEFVRAKGDGPLFYRRSSGKATKRHASKGVANRLAGWVRDSGFRDPRKSPNHALRHWFKSAAARAGISDSLADAIQGHAGKTVASRYRHFDTESMAKAIASLPLPPAGGEKG